MIDNPQGERGYGRGLAAGMLEGAGDLVSGMTSPLSIGMSLLGAPWLKGAQKLTGLGNFARRVMPDSPPTSIGPSVSIPELVARGGEGAFNTARSIYQNPAARSVEDVAYEVVRRGQDPINRSIGGSFNLAEAMRRMNLR